MYIQRDHTPRQPMVSYAPDQPVSTIYLVALSCILTVVFVSVIVTAAAYGWLPAVAQDSAGLGIA